MKTIQDIEKLIDNEIKSIKTLDNEKRGGASNEEWAKRQKRILKLKGKHKEEIKHLRRLLVFVETVPEEGVRFMFDKLTREVTAAIKSSTIFPLKEQQKEYLTNADIPLKKKQIKELDFLLR